MIDRTAYNLDGISVQRQNTRYKRGLITVRACSTRQQRKLSCVRILQTLASELDSKSPFADLLLVPVRVASRDGRCNREFFCPMPRRVQLDTLFGEKLLDHSIGRRFGALNRPTVSITPCTKYCINFTTTPYLSLLVSQAKPKEKVRLVPVRLPHTSCQSHSVRTPQHSRGSPLYLILPLAATYGKAPLGGPSVGFLHVTYNRSA